MKSVCSAAFFFLFCFILFSTHFAHAESFSTSDMAGEWSGYFLESTGDSSYWIYGEITVGQAGELTGGRWTAVSGAEGDFVDGSLVLDKGGVLTGTIRTKADGSLEIGTMTLTHAKMDKGKELAHGVVRKDNGYMDLVTLVRKSSTSFAASDLYGNWFGFLHSTDGWQTQDNWFMDLRMTDLGIIGTWQSVQAAASGGLNGTPFDVDGTGAISGILQISPVADTLWTRSGQLTGSKSAFALVDVKSSGFIDFGFYLKAGATDYKTGDLQGTWAIYSFQVASAEGLVYWVYGTIILDTDGNCIGGEWEAVDGVTTGTFAGGTLSLTSDGKLSGTLKSSNNIVLTIQSGFMDSGKSMAAIVSSPNSTTSDLGYLLKMEPDFPWPMFMPAIYEGRQ